MMKKNITILLLCLLVVTFAYGCSDKQEETASVSKVKEYKSSKDFSKVEIGESVNFGKYENKVLNWTVLEKKKSKILIASNSCIEDKQYNDDRKDVTWEVCTLREWLNNTFYNSAFSDEDKNKIILTNNVNCDNYTYSIDGGENTKDYVFLLSSEEIENYILDKSERIIKNDFWWTRTPGMTKHSASVVNEKGDILYTGSVVNKNNGVRPVLWIKY